MHSIPVGPFDLQYIVGKGGMGEVWHGVHREQGVPVAVKVITASSARQERYLEAFRNEVRAVARLDHPGIVWVLDYGTLPDEAEAASNGSMVAGSPYLAMEYASGGTLHGVMQEMDWLAVKRVLLELLDALAHAHARGVVHRDLKPGNVLLARANDVRPGLKLTDFGIARAIDFKPEEIGSKPLGTLHYMAPEQVRAEWHEQGPWTDLYAVGCMAYRFVSGQLPFHGRRAAALMHAQVRKMPPAPHVRFEAPPNLVDWIWTLIAKDPHDRFRSAADAAHALLSMKDPAGLDTADIGSLAAKFTSGAQAAQHASLPLLTSLVSGEQPEISGPDEQTDDVTKTHLHRTRPPQPRSWRRRIPTRPSPQLLGAGLGLWGIRTVPLVGRESERNTLWNAMREVRRRGRPRVVVVRGTTGTGKTRLAEWIGQRVEEVGSSMCFGGRCSRGGPVGHGVRDMFARALRTIGLSRDDLLDRIDLEMEPRGLSNAADRLAVAALCAPDGLLRDGILDPANRLDVAVETLQTLTRERSIYLWLDDAHHDPDTLTLTRKILDTPIENTLPILIVLVVSDEDLAHSDLAPEFEALSEHEHTLVVELHDLKRSHRSVLIRELLGLAPILAAQVEQRTGGNPLFTVQLVNQWVAADQLIVGPDGFRLRDPDQASIPQSLDEVWSGHIQRILDGFPTQALSMLQRAAVLGRDVDWLQWSRICDDPDGDAGRVGQIYFRPDAAKMRHQLSNRMLDAHLAEETEDGWCFTHGMLRETILAGAREAGGLEDLHRSAAAMLKIHGEGPADEERRALHLMQAGGSLQAIPLLLKAVERRSAQSLPAALELVARTETALRTAAVPTADVAWGRLGLARCQVIARLGRHRQAIEPVVELARSAKQHGWTEVLIEVRIARLGLALALEEPGGLERALQLRQDLTATGSPEQRARSLALLAEIYAARGEVDQAFAAASEVIALTGGQDELHAAAGWSLMGRLCILKNDHVEAMGLLTHAVRVYREHPSYPLALAESLTALGQTEAELGQLGRAQRALTEAVRLYRRTGSGREGLALLALGELLLIRESWRDAMLVWTHARRAIGDRPAPSLQLHCHCGMAASAAGLRDWSACARHLGNGERASEQLRAYHDPRSAPILLETAHRLRQRKRIDLAQRSIRLTRRLLRASGDSEGLNRVEAIMDRWAST